MVSGLNVSLLADAMDLVTRTDATTAATQLLLRPDSTLEALSAARGEARMMLEDSEEEWLSDTLRQADEALSIAERLRS
ncbi:hypothetical protein [Paenarthrobacter sp. A20]|uniref:hypothetical protein n=1 Tax=Paenarthrobacter sp. A20 TaxID=2817891 RepID=UPI00209ED642|nr:hypothetical protein [Paenarthrobacter sp. A20]MCP1415646.1 hypothetical protein [Paenarthrobacter sp. A20]